MRVLLVQSFVGEGIPLVFPIGLSYIAGSLEGHEVAGFDPNVEPDYLKALESVLKEFKPEVVGISLRNIWPFDFGKFKGLYYKEAVEPVLACVKKHSNAKIAMGGAGFTAYASEIMEELKDVDYGVFRDGEDTFAGLLKNLDTPDRVKGVYFRRGGKIVFTGSAFSKPLDKLPLPRRDIFKIEKYTGIPDAIGVQTKRGCAFKCSYCVYPFISGQKILSRPAAKVVDEIERLQKEHGINEVVFVDTVFNAPVSQSKEICSEFTRRKLGVKWSAWFNPKGLTEDYVRMCVEAGCQMFEFSPDAYTDSMLTLLKKNITKADIENSVKVMASVEGANAGYNFFVNGPGESLFTLFQLFAFYVRAKKALKGRLKRFYAGHLHIDPNTDLFSLAVEKGMLDPNANFLGSMDVYNKMIYRNSALVTAMTKSMMKARNAVKFITAR